MKLSLVLTINIHTIFSHFLGFQFCISSWNFKIFKISYLNQFEESNTTVECCVHSSDSVFCKCITNNQMLIKILDNIFSNLQNSRFNKFEISNISIECCIQHSDGVLWSTSPTTRCSLLYHLNELVEPIWLCQCITMKYCIKI